MLIENDIKKLLSDLNHYHVAEISYAGSNLTLKIWEEGRKLSLSAPVYWGGNYIPPSVRACMKKRAPFDEGLIATFLTVDEERFEITLNYVGALVPQLGELVEEFTFLASQWREWLDEHDKNDLVHVRVK